MKWVGASEDATRGEYVCNGLVIALDSSLQGSYPRMDGRARQVIAHSSIVRPIDAMMIAGAVDRGKRAIRDASSVRCATSRV